MEDIIEVKRKDHVTTVQDLIDALMQVEDKSSHIYGYMSDGAMISMDSLTIDSLDLSLEGKVDLNLLI